MQNFSLYRVNVVVTGQGDRRGPRCGVFEFMELKEENLVPWPTLMAQLMMFVPVPWRS